MIARERAQSFLRPEHQARILSAYHDFTDDPGFAAVGDVADVLAPDDNLSIARYVMRAKAAVVLADVGLGDRGHHFPRQLSGGELQRFAIARALIHRPKLVLADEPTGNLDPDTAHEILQLIRTEIKAHGATGIIVTHSHAAAATADMILNLTKDGLHPVESEARSQ